MPEIFNLQRKKVGLEILFIGRIVAYIIPDYRLNPFALKCGETDLYLSKLSQKEALGASPTYT